MSKPFKIIMAGLVLLLLVAFLLVDAIPPRSLTVTRMFVTKRRILQYARQNKRLPSTLATLPEMLGYDTETTDAWNRPFDYSVDVSGIVILQSFGADRRPGGEGDNRDLIGILPAITPKATGKRS